MRRWLIRAIYRLGLVQDCRDFWGSEATLANLWHYRTLPWRELKRRRDVHPMP